MYWSPCESKTEREFPTENYQVGDFKYTRTNPDGWTGGQRVVLWRAVRRCYSNSNFMIFEKIALGSPLKCYKKKMEIITGKKPKNTDCIVPLYRGYIGDGWGDEVDYEWECN